MLKSIIGRILSIIGRGLALTVRNTINYKGAHSAYNLLYGNTTLPSSERLREHKNLETDWPRNKIPTKFITNQNTKIYTTKFNTRTVFWYLCIDHDNIPIHLPTDCYQSLFLTAILNVRNSVIILCLAASFLQPQTVLSGISHIFLTR